MNEIAGFDELARNLKRLVQSVEKTEDEALQEGGKPIAETAKANAPRLSGQGAESITVGEVEQERDGKFVRVGPTDRGWYLLFHEIGTSKMPARPFLRPAFDQQESAARDKIGEILGKRIMQEADRL